MDSQWVKLSPSLINGLNLINKLDDSKYEQFLKRIVLKIKSHDNELFTENEKKKLEKIFKLDEDELLLAIKSSFYLLKRVLKYIFMPSELKNSLCNIGLSEVKSETFVKIWSSETKIVLDEINSDKNNKQMDQLNLSWKLNAELSSEYQKTSKIPKAYLTFTRGINDTQLECTHSELYNVYLQLEAIQNELDNL